jgi:hypothetical protein
MYEPAKAGSADLRRPEGEILAPSQKCLCSCRNLEPLESPVKPQVCRSSAALPPEGPVGQRACWAARSSVYHNIRVIEVNKVVRLDLIIPCLCRNKPHEMAERGCARAINLDSAGRVVQRGARDNLVNCDPRAVLDNAREAGRS